MRKPNTKGKNNNTMWFKVWEKNCKQQKYITITIVNLIVLYVTFVFLATNLIGDVYEARDHEFLQLYEDMPHSTDEGLVTQWALGYYLPHPHAQMQGRTNIVRLQ